MKRLGLGFIFAVVAWSGLALVASSKKTGSFACGDEQISCSLWVETQELESFRAFSGQWTEAAAQTPVSRLQNDTVLMVKGDGTFLSSTIEEGEAPTPSATVSYRNRIGKPIFLLTISASTIDEIELKRAALEPMLRGYLIYHGYSPVSDRDTGPLSNPQFEVDPKGLHLKFAWNGEVYRFFLEPLKSFAAKGWVCPEGQIIKAVAGDRWVAIQFEHSSIQVKRVKAEPPLCTTRLSALKVDLEGQSPSASYNGRTRIAERVATGEPTIDQQ